MNHIQKIINKFGVNKNFTDGSYITPLHRMALRYVEGDKSIDIGYDHIPWTNKYEIISESLKCWNSPYDSEGISIEKKNEILQKTIEYSKSRKHNAVIV